MTFNLIGGLYSTEIHTRLDISNRQYKKRELSSKQLTQIQEIINENLLENGGMLRVQNSLDSLTDNDIIVLTHLMNEDDRIIGYALLKPVYNYTKEYWIETAGILHKKTWQDYQTCHALYLYQIATSKEFQKQSVGKALLNDILHYYGCAMLSNVSVKNEPSLKLHKHFGFTEVGLYERDNFGGEQNYKSYLLCTGYIIS